MTLLLGFGAVNTGNNLLYLMVSALLGFMAVSGVVGRGNIAALEVDIELPREIYAGRETLARIKVVNRSRFFHAFLVQVQLLDSSTLFTFIGRRGAITEGVAVTFARRGCHPLPPVRILSIFPINFFVRTRGVAVPGFVTVFPAPTPCRAGAAGGSRGRVDERGQARGYAGDIRRIIGYRGGDPLKLIHWKLSARQEELQIKELSAGTADPVILHLEEMPGGDIETRLCCSVFLINRYQRENRPVGLRLGGRLIPPDLSPSHRLRMLKELALYGQHQETA